MDKAAPTELATVYAQRFGPMEDYRRRVWQVLVQRFFQRWVPQAGTLLDLGCGYGEFVNAIKANRKIAMDLNPNSPAHLAPGIQFIQQDCSAPWPLGDRELDVVFTSNFFEHLPDKTTLGKTLEQAFRCLKSGGRLIALGPNIRFTGGRYWDFWDHYLPLTDVSLCEGLKTRGFKIEESHPRFLPYTMVGGPQYPLWMLSLYLRLPFLWRLRGQQFLVVARKPELHA
jgi:SAM-dependent methyltransferase